MSSATPNKRLQLKTSDLADFFRGSSTGLSSTNSGRSAPLIDETRLSTSSSPSRKRSTRIPFIGRPRKKSVHSDVAPSVASEARQSRSSVATGSGSILEQPNSIVALHASTSQHSLQSMSLGSKIVARFTPSKSRSGSKLQSRKSPAKTHEEVSDYASDSIVSPSLAPRSPSIDSKFSRVSRSSTPRASQANEKASGGSGGLHSQPTITVSRPPVDNLDNMDQYDDLFTKPPHRIKQKPVPVDTRPLASLPREPPLRDTLSPSPPPSAISLVTPTISRTPSVSVRAPAPTAADIIRRSATISRMHKLSYSPAPSPSGSNSAPIGGSSSIRRGDSVIRQHQDSDIDPAEESEAMSVKSAMSMPASFRSSVNRSSTVAGTRGKPRPFTTSYTLKGSRMLQPSKPPSIPLPSTPSSSNETPTTRPRAHTISSSRLARPSGSPPKDNPQKRNSPVSKTVGRSSPLSKETATPLHSTNSSSSSSSSSSTPTLTKTITSSEAGHIDIDIDSASADELRKALRLRNQQFNRLSHQFVEVMAAHTAERGIWENKVTELEKELARKQSEIKGFSWIVKNEEYDNPSSTMQSGSRTPSLLERERSDDSSTRSSIPTPSSFVRLPLFQLRQGEDSGAESNPTSQSEWGSGTEDDQYMAAMKPKRAMRRLRLVESVNKAMYPASIKQPGSGAGSDTSEVVSDSPYLGQSNKRSSTSSSFTVASSSPPTSPEPTSVNFPSSQNLNPIPESRPSSVVPESREEPKRERRPSRISFGSLGQPSAASKSQSKSIPSVTNGSRLTPSEAYVRTLQKGRPPSIAQVLDQGKKVEQPSMSSIEESYGGRSRAILAGLSSPGRK